MKARDLFISHSSADAEAARQLRRDLEDAGYTCWMAPDDVVGTETWTEQILDAIGACRAALVLVSATANQSTHVSREVNLALGRGRPVLPIRIESVAPEGSLEYLLSLVQRVDAFPPPVSDHREEILRRLQGIVPPAGAEGAPASEPGPPKVGAEPSPAREAGKAESEFPAGATPPVPKPRKRAGDRHAAGIGPGSDVGGFVIEEVLGEGGMARVFRARQSEPSRAVALKVIRSDHARNAAYRQGFVTEKATLASLEHPSIVPIYAAGDDDGVLYIAMRLIDGVDLKTRIANQGRLSIRETVDILRPVADAIDYAHEMGVIHRDLKPANVILDRRGRPYLTDFGIGEPTDAKSAGPIAAIAMGTVEYMAPELATPGDGSAVGQAIDVYALGCIAFECLAGKPPFVRDSPDAVIAAHVNDQVPSLRAMRAEIPKAVDELVGKALAKDPAARFGTAGEFVSGLETVARAASQGSTQPVVLPEMQRPSARARRWLGANMPLAVIGSSLGAIALAVAVVMAIGGGGDTDPTSSPSRSAVGTTAATPAGDAQPPAGGSVEVRAADGSTTVTTDHLVTVAVTTPPTDASPVSFYLAANSPVRPPLADALAYSSTFAWALDENDQAAGDRSVYVWFGDAQRNWTSTPVQSTITFDNAPEVKNGLFFNRTGAKWCTSLDHQETLVLVGDVASDPDGNDSLRVTAVWTGGDTFPGDADLSRGITADGLGVTLRITPPDAAYRRYVDWFRVEDEHGVSADGWFNLEVGSVTAC
jgi:serine/threonine-protein kinase